MFPDKFDYYEVDSTSEAVNVLSENTEAELLSGGHSLIPTMKSGLASPDVIVDIGSIDKLSRIEHDDEQTRVGATTRYSDVATDDLLWEGAVAVPEAAGEIGDRQVRNRGTVGGNIAHADPASDLPGAILAADATITIQQPHGTRKVSADDFFQGIYNTDVDEDEIITEITIPRKWSTGAYLKKPNTSGYALVGVAVQLEIDGSEINTARIATNGVMDHSVRLSETEEVLEENLLTNEIIKDASDVAGNSLNNSMVLEDQQASSEFRLELLASYTKQALQRAENRINHS